MIRIGVGVVLSMELPSAPNELNRVARLGIDDDKGKENPFKTRL